MDISKIGENGKLLFVLFFRWGKRKNLICVFFFFLQFLRKKKCRKK